MYSRGYSGNGGEGDMVTVGFMAVAGVMVAVTVKSGAREPGQSGKCFSKAGRPEDLKTT